MNLKNKTKGWIQQNKNRLSDTENKLVVTNGEKEWGEGQYRGMGLRDTNYNVLNKQQR